MILERVCGQGANQSAGTLALPSRGVGGTKAVTAVTIVMDDGSVADPAGCKRWNGRTGGGRHPQFGSGRSGGGLSSGCSFSCVLLLGPASVQAGATWSAHAGW